MLDCLHGVALMANNSILLLYILIHIKSVPVSYAVTACKLWSAPDGVWYSKKKGWVPSNLLNQEEIKKLNFVIWPTAVFSDS